MAVRSMGIGLWLKDMPEDEKTPDICMKAVEENGLMLKFVPDRYRTPELCLKAVGGAPWACRQVPDRVKSPEFLEKAVKATGMEPELLGGAFFRHLSTPEMLGRMAKACGAAPAAGLDAKGGTAKPAGKGRSKALELCGLEKALQAVLQDRAGQGAAPAPAC